MTSLLCINDSVCVEARRRELPDGSLLGLFVDADDQLVLTTAVSEGTADVDELFLRHLVAMVTDVGVAAVIFAVVRAAGRPLPVDRRLWRELRARLAAHPTDLLDLIVVGSVNSWSAAGSSRRPA